MDNILNMIVNIIGENEDKAAFVIVSTLIIFGLFIAWLTTPKEERKDSIISHWAHFFFAPFNPLNWLAPILTGVILFLIIFLIGKVFFTEGTLVTSHSSPDSIIEKTLPKNESR